MTAMREETPILLPPAGEDWCEPGRTPATAAVQRGACRLLRAHGFATLTELSLATGRRVDIMAINAKGAIWVVEIKSCVADLRCDSKWQDYEGYGDRLYFAVPPGVPPDAMPALSGLIVADQWSAEIVRECAERSLPAARRKAVTLRFARAAALRLHSLRDPEAEFGNLI
jgi:hypothetical protein